MMKELSGLAWKRSSSWVIISLCTCTVRSRYVTQRILTHAVRRAVCMTDVRGRSILKKQMTRSTLWLRDHSCEKRKIIKRHIFRKLSKDYRALTPKVIYISRLQWSAQITANSNCLLNHLPGVQRQNGKEYVDKCIYWEHKTKLSELGYTKSEWYHLVSRSPISEYSY